MKFYTNKSESPVKVLVLVQWLKHLDENNNLEPSFYTIIKGRQFWIFKYMSKSKIETSVDGVITKKNQWKYTILPNFLKIISYIPKFKNYDVVVSIGFINGLILSFLRKILQYPSTKHIIIDATVATTLSDLNKTTLKIIQWILSPVDSVITFSQQQCIYWNNNLGIPSEKINFFPLSVDFDFWSINSENECNYVFSGGKSGRDYTTLLSALKDTNIPLVLVTSKDYLNTISDGENISISHNIEFIEDVPISTFRDLLINSKIVVIPLNANSPTGQTVLVEAMAAKKAIIVTRSPGTIDYVIDGTNAIFVEAGDVEELNEKICYLYHNEAEIERLGKNARKSAEDLFSEIKFSQKFMDLLDRIIKN